ncbi:hypothetical protein [Kineococcus aurantiacus]|uniref:Pimeloyl-ACP methyl ester carboxylesterase n=1 Tax=Kineococcus aurantiacus TaxID=37633 RepID=A0A7Y9ARS0_9ACTN|nr:hypothetical protein [Kineococcus aurantiacus]NYD20587.1 pimeloyl-ACP methyl ester carboxylesterase [Kineococcus aurantiacus]
MSGVVVGDGLADWELAEIERANGSGLQPVVLVHGLWLLSSSWQPRRDLLETHGRTTVAPGRPDHPGTVEEAFAGPDVLARGGTRVDRFSPDRTAPCWSWRGEQQHRTGEDRRAISGLQRRNPGLIEFVTVPGHGHSTTIDHGGKEVAQPGVEFIARSAR